MVSSGSLLSCVAMFFSVGSHFFFFFFFFSEGAQWLSGRVLDSRPRGRGFEPHRRHCVVSLSKNINPSLVLVQPRKTRPFKTEILLMGRKESNQTNKTIFLVKNAFFFTNFCVYSITPKLFKEFGWTLIGM